MTLHVKHKSAVVPVHAMSEYRKHRSISSLTVNHSSEGVVSIMHWQLYPQKSQLYPLNKRLGGSQSWSGHSGEVKCLLDLLRFKLWSLLQSSHYTYYTIPAPYILPILSVKWITSIATMQNFEATDKFNAFRTCNYIISFSKKLNPHTNKQTNKNKRYVELEICH